MVGVWGTRGGSFEGLACFKGEAGSGLWEEAGLGGGECREAGERVLVWRSGRGMVRGSGLGCRGVCVR